MILPTKEKFLKDILLSSLKNLDDLMLLDCTCGNGYDTLFLAENFKNSHIEAIDLQQEAINNTKKLCKEFDNINYYSISHDIFLKNSKKNYDFIIFNTGYLPNSKSNIKTNHKSTILALEYGLNKLKSNRFLAITLYKGHDNSFEYKNVLNYLKNLNKYEYIVFSYKTENTNNSPTLFIIEKKEKRN